MKQTYVYSGDEYELTTTRRRDERAGRRFADKKLIAHSTSVALLIGTIRNTRTGSKTPFRLWTAENQTVPLRIEYQPRSFLQLALEAEA